MKSINELSDIELREAVAVEVMGWQRHELIDATVEFPRCRWCGSTFYHGDPRDGWCFQGDPPAYESSIEAALQVVDACRANGVMLEVTAMGWGYLVNVQVLKQNKLEFTGTFKANSYAKLPLAICRAALTALRARKA